MATEIAMEADLNHLIQEQHGKRYPQLQRTMKELVAVVYHEIKQEGVDIGPAWRWTWPYRMVLFPPNSKLI